MVHPRIGALVAVVAAASIVGWRAGATRPSHEARSTQAAFVVTRAIDGDTIDVTDGRSRIRVRLLGVDTPEVHHPTKPVQCFGPEAARFTARELVGRHVGLERDRVTRDKYGRLLAYVIVNGERFNDVLLRDGYGRLLVIAPNGKYARTMLEEELQARAARRGLWGAC